MQKLRAYPGRLIFDHLPKTGGTTIHAWLRESLGTGCVSPQLDGPHSDLIQSYGGRYSIISAHIHFEAGETMDPRYSYVTCIREPIERVISVLYYTLNNIDSSRFPKFNEWVKSFVESDGQQLADELIPSISNLYSNHFARIEQGNEIAQAHSIANSLRVVSLYDVVGFQDNLLGFANDLADHIGIQSPENFENLNVTTQRPNVADVAFALRQRIVELNQLDLKLYAEIRAGIAKPKKRDRPNAKQSSKIHWQQYDHCPLPITSAGNLVVVTEISLRGGFYVIQGQLAVVDAEVFFARDVKELLVDFQILDRNGGVAFNTSDLKFSAQPKETKKGSYRASMLFAAGLPIGRYTARIAISEVSHGREWQFVSDHTLCEFQIVFDDILEHSGYVNLPAEMVLLPTDIHSDANVIVRPIGGVTIVENISTMRTNEKRQVRVQIENQGSRPWTGDLFRPVCLSYHWIDATGRTTVHDGERTAIPANQRHTGKAHSMKILVIAPALPGQYTMVATLVQETVGWFEEMSPEFLPARIRIEVR